jgi:hypothetical protein
MQQRSPTHLAANPSVRNLSGMNEQWSGGSPWAQRWIHQSALEIGPR